jgi:tetratricopeptide (TPR) repeat protein
VDIKNWYQLLDQGWTKELEEAVENLGGEDRLEGELWKIVWLGYFHGQFEEAELNAKRFLKRPNLSFRIKIVAHLVIADLLKNKRYGEFYDKEIDKIQSLFDRLSDSQQKEYRHYEVWFHYLHSCYNAFYVNDYSTAFRLISKAIKLTREENVSIRYFEPMCIWMRGNFYSYIGEYQESIADYCESIELYRHLGNDSMIIWVLIALSDVYRYLGELEKALELNTEILDIAKKLEYKEQLRTAYTTTGMLLFIRGDFYEAKLNFEEAMNNVLEKKMDYLNIYNNYIQVLLEIEESEQVKDHLTEFNRLSKELGDEWYPQWIEAIYLKKTGDNFATKAKALQLFRDLSESTDINFQWKSTIIFHLIDLLLEEARLLDNPINMQEVNLLIDQLSEMAQQVPRTLIQIYLLQGKILLIDGKLEKSVSLLEKAHSLATSKNLNLLADQAKLQQKQLQSEMKKWRGLMESNASLAERLEFTDVKVYLQNAIKLRDLSGSLSDNLRLTDNK